jgi:hypothetical protein
MLIRSKKYEHIYQNGEVRSKIADFLIKNSKNSQEYFHFMKYINFSCLKIDDLKRIAVSLSDYQLVRVLLDLPTIGLELLRSFFNEANKLEF